MLVKVCGMREPENITQLVSLVDPDLMGMIFYPKSSRYVSETFPPIESQKVPKVGVFVNNTVVEVLEKVKKFDLAYVQLHGDEDVSFVKELAEKSAASIIKVFRVSSEIDWVYLRSFEPYISYFLFDTQTKDYGGSGKQFDWQVLADYPLKRPFLLSGGLDEGDVGEIWHLKKVQPALAGVDINSKFEVAPGLKDVEKVKRFVDSLRSKK